MITFQSREPIGEENAIKGSNAAENRLATPETETLDIPRLYAAPNLNGTSPKMAKISPDSKRVTFLKGKDTDPLQLDLWEFNLADEVVRLLVDSAELTDGQEILTERYLGTPQENPEGYKASGVFPYTRNLNAPLLVLHGMADDNVLFTNSTKLFNALQKEGRQFDMMTYPGSKHGLTRVPSTGQHAYSHILRFFKQHLRE